MLNDTTWNGRIIRQNHRVNLGRQPGQLQTGKIKILNEQTKKHF